MIRRGILLTGSTNLALMEGVSASLAGRAGAKFLCRRVCPGEWLGTRALLDTLDLLFSESFAPRKWPAGKSDWNSWAVKGGYPGECPTIRSTKPKTKTETDFAIHLDRGRSDHLPGLCGLFWNFPKARKKLLGETAEKSHLPNVPVLAGRGCRIMPATCCIAPDFCRFLLGRASLPRFSVPLLLEPLLAPLPPRGCPCRYLEDLVAALIEKRDAGEIEEEY